VVIEEEGVCEKWGLDKPPPPNFEEGKEVSLFLLGGGREGGHLNELGTNPNPYGEGGTELGFLKGRNEDFAVSPLITHRGERGVESIFQGTGIKQVQMCPFTFAEEEGGGALFSGMRRG